MKCRTCKKPIGEIFGFCASCGEPLCPDCLWKYARRHEEIKIIGIPGIVRKTTRLGLRLPRCVGCVNAYIRASKQSIRHFRRDMFVATLAYFAPTLGISLYVLLSEMADILQSLLCIGFLALIVFLPGLFLGYTVATSLRKRRMKEALRDRPLVFESKIFCPSCGNYSEKDLFRPAKKAVKSQVGLLGSMFSYSEKVQGLYECSKCGYNDILTPAMGIRLYLETHGRAGREKLGGTAWESLSKRLYGRFQDR